MRAGSTGVDGCHLWPYVAGGDGATGAEYEVAVVLDSRPEPFGRMVDKLFDRQPVDVAGEDGPGDAEQEIDADADADADVDGDGDRVVLLDDGAPVAASPLGALSETILLVNSDLYRTGAVDLEEVRLPAVIRELSGTTFHARGFPESNYEKMPLILISRYIELLSYRHGGTHRASFQELSRIRDERGTRNVYRRLGTTTADLHVYGVPDWVPPREMGATIHGGYGGDFDRSWFVLHRSPAAAAALVALETAPNEWQSRWTFDRELVADVEATITEHL